MWRWAIFFLVLAFLSGGLVLACESSAASGLAWMLMTAFVGLAGFIMALEGRQAPTVS